MTKLALISLLFCGLLNAQAAKQPNIVLIMVDDMSWSDIGCYGSEIETPNIDSLAKEDLLWTNFYNNGKCATTRASLLTGLYPRNGGKGSELLNEKMLTLGEALRPHGYATGLSGKWHNGSQAPNRPFDRGFDKSYGLWDGCCNFFDPSIRDPKFKGNRARFYGEDDRKIEGNQSWETSKNEDLEWELLRMTYAAMVDSVDQNIGRLMATLKELEVDKNDKNTLVIFLSDNGACAEIPGGDNTQYRPGPKEWYSHVGPNWAWAQNSPWRYYKSHAHEGGIASPCVMRWPNKIPQGEKTHQVGHIIDFLPTFLAMAGGTYPSESEQGANLIPAEGIDLTLLLSELDKVSSRPSPLFWQWAGHGAVRDGKWKLVRFKKTNIWELYDLSKNRTETSDLAKDHPERVEQMAKAWKAWAKLTGVEK